MGELTAVIDFTESEPTAPGALPITDTMVGAAVERAAGRYPEEARVESMLQQPRLTLTMDELDERAG